jgi:hypothetical protein
MTKRRRLKIQIGKQNVRAATPYPSEPGYVAQMQSQAKKMTDTLLDILDQFKDVSEDLMLEALEPTGEKSQVYCPKDTHELVDSFYLVKAPFRGKPRVEMGYARNSKPPYAVFVHEIPTHQHEYPTRYKFLEQAMKEDLEMIHFRLNILYRDFMSGGSRG